MSPKYIFNQYMYERYTHGDAYLHLFEHFSDSEDMRPFVLILTELLQDYTAMPGYICSLLKLSPDATYAEGAKNYYTTLKRHSHMDDPSPFSEILCKQEGSWILSSDAKIR